MDSNHQVEEFVSAEPTYALKSDIQSVAEKAAKILEYKPGTDLKGIVRSLGGKISILSPFEFSEETDASITIYGKGNFEIKLSAFTSPLRDRFSIAHELGHLFLHFNEIPMQAKRSGSDRAEWEANWFAAAFLMGERRFKEAFIKYNKDCDKVAAHFKVSSVAARVRAKDLNLL